MKDNQFKFKLEFILTKDSKDDIYQPLNPYIVITVRCKVREVSHKNLPQKSFENKIGMPFVPIQFIPFDEHPVCGYEWSYTLSIFDIESLEESISFDQLIKNPERQGEIPKGLEARLVNQIVYIQTGDAALKDKYFVAFISGTLATNPNVQTNILKQNFELVRFKVISAEFSLANSPPMFTNHVTSQACIHFFVVKPF